MKLSLGSDFKKIVPALKKWQVYLVGVALIGLFGYTAYAINQALNVQPAGGTATASPSAKIKFDKATIDAVKRLDVVQGSVPSGGLGKSDPFN